MTNGKGKNVWTLHVYIDFCLLFVFLVCNVSGASVFRSNKLKFFKMEETRSPETSVHIQKIPCHIPENAKRYTHILSLYIKL